MNIKRSIYIYIYLTIYLNINLITLRYKNKLSIYLFIYISNNNYDHHRLLLSYHFIPSCLYVYICFYKDIYIYINENKYLGYIIVIWWYDMIEKKRRRIIIIIQFIYKINIYVEFIIISQQQQQLKKLFSIIYSYLFFSQMNILNMYR